MNSTQPSEPNQSQRELKHPMSSISPLRFGLWVLAVCLGCYQILFQSGFVGLLVLSFSGLLLVTRGEFSSPISSKNGWVSIGGLLVMMVGMCLVAFYFPMSAGEVVMTHPAVVIPMWGFVIGIVFRRWRLDRRSLRDGQTLAN